MEDKREEEGDEEEDDEELDVRRFVGQCLYKGKSSPDEADLSAFIKQQASFLTGAPLIKSGTASSTPSSPSSSSSSQPTTQFQAATNPHLIMSLLQQHQQHLAYFYFCQQQQQLLHHHQQQQQQHMRGAGCSSPRPIIHFEGHLEAAFVPRVLRPRRRRRPANDGSKPALTPIAPPAAASSTPSSGDLFPQQPANGEVNPNNNNAEVEIGSEDEHLFLPTDLLSEDQDSPRPHSQLRQTESLNVYPAAKTGNINNNNEGETEKNSFISQDAHHHHHSPLRKTYSWAENNNNTTNNGNNNNYSSNTDRAFSLFPQTSESDLLCSVRNRLFDSTVKKSTNNLELALKSLSIENNETSNSRKF